jgi:hypothetical protein
MQRGKCPECGSQIGGENHVNAKGVKEKDLVVDFSTGGFNFADGELVSRCNNETVFFFRFIIYLAMHLGILIDSESKDSNGSKEKLEKEISEDAKEEKDKIKPVSDLLKYFKFENEDDALKRLCTSVGYHFQMLMGIFGSSSSVGQYLQATLYSFLEKDTFFGESDKVLKKDAVLTFEMESSIICNSTKYDVINVINEKVGISSQIQRETILKKSIGIDMWKYINASPPSFLWKYFPEISMNSFLLSVGNYGKNAKDAKDASNRNESAKETTNGSFEENYPVLHAFIEQEQQLHHVKSIISILQWHRILFTMFPNNELSREDASGITNIDVVNRITNETEKNQAYSIMMDFCNAFNESFSLVTLLFECQPNPFLNSNGEVDLSGTNNEKENNLGNQINNKRVLMSPSTSILFSLPAVSRGEVIATGLCTIQLLNRLYRIHENSLGIAGNANRNADGANGANRNPNDAPDAILPEISYVTSPIVMQRWLVNYERQTQFVPLLHTAAEINYDNNEICFNFENIEYGLRTGVLSGKQSVRLNIKHYQYRGEIRNSNHISGLRDRVPQTNISLPILQLICAEVDTLNKMDALMAKLEIIINYLTSIGGEGVREMSIGEMKIR